MDGEIIGVGNASGSWGYDNTQETWQGKTAKVCLTKFIVHRWEKVLQLHGHSKCAGNSASDDVPEHPFVMMPW